MHVWKALVCRRHHGLFTLPRWEARRAHTPQGCGATTGQGAAPLQGPHHILLPLAPTRDQGRSLSIVPYFPTPSLHGPENQRLSLEFTDRLQTPKQRNAKWWCIFTGLKSVCACVTAPQQASSCSCSTAPGWGSFLRYAYCSQHIPKKQDLLAFHPHSRML